MCFVTFPVWRVVQVESRLYLFDLIYGFIAVLELKCCKSQINQLKRAEMLCREVRSCVISDRVTV